MPPCEGGYKEFEIGKLFDGNYGDKDIQAKHINGKGINVVSSGTKNNGIIGSTDMPARIFPANTITIDMFGNCFFRHAPYKMVTHARVFSLSWKNGDLNRYLGLYLSATFAHLSQVYSYNNMCSWEKIKDSNILLPVSKSGEIDFQFIESRIRELEEERMRELEAYLSAAGFADCSLTPTEEEALRKFSNGEVKSNIFKVGALFSARTGDVDLQNKDINGRGEYFVNSGTQNFGIKGRTDRPARIFSANTLTIDFFGNVNYRPYKYKMATHNHVFSLSGESIKNEPIGLYFAVAMNYMSKLFSFNNMGTWNVIKDLKVNLPCTSFGEIDYDFMETYISAIKKQIIQQLKNFIAKEHSAYQQVINH